MNKYQIEKRIKEETDLLNSLDTEIGLLKSNLLNCKSYVLHIEYVNKITEKQKEFNKVSNRIEKLKTKL